MTLTNKLIIYLDDKPLYRINSTLLTRQDCWENLDKIKEEHANKLMIYEIITNEINQVVLKDLVNEITMCEFRLQELWKFSKDARFHRFWETPKCLCPKIDNNDNYPTGYYSVSSGCPLHS